MPFFILIFKFSQEFLKFLIYSISIYKWINCWYKRLTFKI